MNDELATVKKSYAQKAEQPTEELRARLASVQSWCEGRWNTLTSASKTAKFSIGEVSWRKRRPKVSVRGKDAVIQALQTAGLERFLRRKVEIDRTTILREWGGMEKATSTYRSAGRDLCGVSSAQGGAGKFPAHMHGRLSRGDPARARRCSRPQGRRGREVGRGVHGVSLCSTSGREACRVAALPSPRQVPG